MEMTIKLEAGEMAIKGIVDNYGRITGLSDYKGRDCVVVILPPVVEGITKNNEAGADGNG